MCNIKKKEKKYICNEIAMKIYDLIITLFHCNFQELYAPQMRPRCI